METSLRVSPAQPGQFAFFFIAQFVSYFIIVANTRAFTSGLYVWTAVTDSLFAAQGFIVLKAMVGGEERTGFWAGVGYTIGGTCGSLCSIWVTKLVFGR